MKESAICKDFLEKIMKTFIKINKQYKQIRWLFCFKKKSMDQKSTKGQDCEMSHRRRV